MAKSKVYLFITGIALLVTLSNAEAFGAAGLGDRFKQKDAPFLINFLKQSNVQDIVKKQEPIIPFEGLMLLCHDHPGIEGLLQGVSEPKNIKWPELQKLDIKYDLINAIINRDIKNVEIFSKQYKENINNFIGIIQSENSYFIITYLFIAVVNSLFDQTEADKDKSSSIIKALLSCDADPNIASKQIIWLKGREDLPPAAFPQPLMLAECIMVFGDRVDLLELLFDHGLSLYAFDYCWCDCQCKKSKKFEENKADEIWRHYRETAWLFNRKKCAKIIDERLTKKGIAFKKQKENRNSDCSE